MIPGYDTKITPAPNPMMVDPAATVVTLFAVAPTIYQSPEQVSPIPFQQAKFP